MVLRRLALLPIITGILLLGGCIFDDEIKLGGIATLEGAFAILGQDAMRGIEMALQEHNYQAGGKKISAVAASSNGDPESAIDAARKLIETQNVDIVIGPLASNEGLAIREYAKTQPQKTFVNGASASSETTLQDPAANFFSFTVDAVQWQAGLGIESQKRYEKVVTIAEDYTLGYSQVNGFMLEYCEAGGQVVDKLWLALDNKDYNALIAAIPDDIDAIYIALSSTNAADFFQYYRAAGGDKPLIAGALSIDQTMLLNEDKRYDYLLGTLSSGPMAISWNDPKWLDFVKRYQDTFWGENAQSQPASDQDENAIRQQVIQAQLSHRFRTPTLFSYSYYVNTKAVLLALDLSGGDLSADQADFRRTLTSLNYPSPTGAIKLDQNRQAIANNFVTEISRDNTGLLYQKVVGIIPEVNQTLGLTRAQFLQLSKDKDSMNCP